MWGQNVLVFECATTSFGDRAAGLHLAPNVDIGLMCELFQKPRHDVTVLCHDEAARFCLQQIMYDRVSCNEHAPYFGIRYNRDSTHAALALIRWSVAPVRHSAGSSAGALLIAFYPLLLSRRSSSLFSNFGPSLTLRYVCY